MSSFSIPPLCLPAVAVNPIHTKCTDLQAYRHKNTEDQFTFMKRVCELSTGEEVHNASYVISQFISLLVDDPLLFRQILDDLESLHIDDGYGKTLFSCILNNGNFEQILLLVEGLKKRNAFSRRKAFEVTLTLYRRKNELQESDALERLLEEVNVPFVNEQGLLENLIFAAHLSDLDLSLIELLNQKKVALPLTEIAIGSAVRNTLSDSAAYLFKTLSKQELRDIIHLSRLRPYFQKTQDAPCTVHIDLPLRPLLVVINTQDLLFDLALGSFEVLEKLCYIVHSANDEQLSQVLQSWLEGKVGPITRLVTSHILSKKSLNSLKQQAFKEEMKNSFLYRWLLEFASQQLPTLKAAFEYNFFLCRVQTSTYRLQTFRSVSRRDIQNVLVLQHMKETSQARNSLKKAAVRLLELFLETAIEVDPVRCTEHKRSMVFYLQDRKRRSHKYEVINYGHAVIQDERRLFTPSFPVASIFRDLKYFLNGDEVEYVGEGGDQSKNLKDNTLWSTEWKFGIARRFYENTAYPILGQIACNILCSRGKKGEMPRIVEICAGDGSLARSILDQAPYSVDYLLLEKNDASITKAKERLKRDAVVVKTDIINSEQYFQDEEKKVALAPDSVDIVIGSGALTVCVLPSEGAALSVLEKIHYYLRPKGFLLLCGLETSLLNSRHFTKVGFSVINASIPGSNDAFYTLQKKT